MDQLIPESFIVTACALIITLIIVPLLTKLSNRLGLIDRPGERKVHFSNTPVIGGMAIVTSVALSLLLSKTALGLIAQYPVMLSGALILFITGVWDDRKNISPSLRLMLQLVCAAAVAASGIRLTSLYGLFGVEEINIYCQYALTILLITGVTNAFNLIDGIDGLAGGIALIGIAAVAMLCLALREYGLFMLFAALAGAITGFLRYNLFPAKIFMGDAGSLTLGFLLPTAGIILIEKAHNTGFAESGYVIVLLMAVLSIPVIDSLRVYISRMMRGGSPFKADKTHLHHMLLHAGFNHGRSTLLICATQLSIVLMAVFFYKIGGVYSSIIAIATVILLGYHTLRLMNRTVPKVEGSF